MRGRHDFIGGMEMRRKRGRVMYFNQHSFFFLPIVCLKDHQTPHIQTLFWLFFLIYGRRKWSFLFTFALELFPIRSNQATPWLTYIAVKTNTLTSDYCFLEITKQSQHFSSNETIIAAMGKRMKSMRNEMQSVLRLTLLAYPTLTTSQSPFPHPYVAYI